MADTSAIALTLRNAISSPISAAQNDANLAAIETAVNANSTRLNKVYKAGSYACVNNTSVIDLPNVNTFYDLNIANLHSHYLDGFTFDNTKKYLVVPTDGNYLCQASISVEPGNAETLQFGFSLGDGTTMDIYSHTRAETVLHTGSRNQVDFHAVLDAVANQRIGVMASTVTGATNITVKHMTVTVSHV